MRARGLDYAADGPGDALACPLCLETFRTPLMLPCCAQSFCADCLAQALDANPYCPLCRCKTQFDTALPNRGLEALLGYAQRDVIAAAAAAAQPPPPPPAAHRIPIRGNGNPFVRQPAERLSTWREWWRVNEPRMRCGFYVVLVITLMVFLRVQEEEYEELEVHHHPRAGHHTSQLEARGHQFALGASAEDPPALQGGAGASGSARVNPGSHPGARESFDAVAGDSSPSLVEAAWAAEKANPISRGNSAYVADAQWAALGMVGALACVLQLGRRAVRGGGQGGESRAAAKRRRRRPQGAGGAAEAACACPA